METMKHNKMKAVYRLSRRIMNKKPIFKYLFLAGVVKKVVLLGFLLYSVVASSQDNIILKAFTDSYTHEYNKEYAKATEAIKTVYQEDSYEMNVRLGWLTYASGNYTGSVGYYQKAIALRPLSEEARMGLVSPAAELGNWDLVINTYRKIMEINPGNTTAAYRMGMIYYYRKDYTTAESYFQKVVNLYPFGHDGLLMMAWTYFQQGKLREAKVLFNKVLLNTPSDTSALEGISLIK